MSIYKKMEKIADHYGLHHQLIKFQEEAAEVQVEIAKYLLSKEKDPTRLKAEMADLAVILFQLTHLLTCEDEMEQTMNEKVERQLERIKEEMEVY